MDEAEIRRMVESRDVSVQARENWLTPAGNRRSSPVYEGELHNHYLQKVKTIKAKSLYEFEARCHESAAKFKEQEIRKRIVDAKRNAKEQAQAEAQRCDAEAKELLRELNSLLEATLSVDDRIYWDAERDTREFPAFSFGPPPLQPPSLELVLPEKPSFSWLLPWRMKRWERACEEERLAHATTTERRLALWQEELRKHAEARAAAEQQHASARAAFVAEQSKFNDGLADFRRRLEAGAPEAIVEYCSLVLERSQYPECLSLSSRIGFDGESGFVVVDLDLPRPGSIPAVCGYKFVARGNRVEPIMLKKKEATMLRASVADQIVLRTIHEILEACYVPVVRGVLLNGWITALDKATGNDERTRVCSVVADRPKFESFDLKRVEPAACIERLGEGVGQMHGASL